LFDVILTRAKALGGTLRGPWIGYTDVKTLGSGMQYAPSYQQH